mmetsp:Transcript_20849/g.32089  ORF Transcript_20849/g.32089 Transcript_20849/m.32089 type:complete len:305 (-) Transcript_20849:109-1023(-)
MGRISYYYYYLCLMWTVVFCWTIIPTTAVLAFVSPTQDFFANHLHRPMMRGPGSTSSSRTTTTYRRGRHDPLVYMNHPKFCEQCGTPTTVRIPEGDERERACCTDPSCGFVSYQNPKVVVGAICYLKEEHKVLLCRRAIEPCKGKWGYPQGFMELGETTREGAVRETWEEAGTTILPEKAQLVAIYNLAGVQVQMIYCCPLEQQENEKTAVNDLVDGTTNDNNNHSVIMECGIESSEVQLFGWDEIPWDDLAFPTVQWALEYVRTCLEEQKDNVGDGSTQNIVPQQRTKVYFDTEDKWGVLEDW